MPSERSAVLPRVTVAVPSLNHGRFIDAALQSIFDQDVAVEVMVADAGSHDGTVERLAHWEPRLAWWRSAPDSGQAAAINEAIAKGRAPYVCWLNADDTFLPGGLSAMLDALHAKPGSPAVYAGAVVTDEAGDRRGTYRTEPFSERRLARRCFVSQPATLIRRDVWNAVGGVDESLHYTMDYDLWWKILRYAGELEHLDRLVATTRAHRDTKTLQHPARQWREAMRVVRRHYGALPVRWYLAWPYSVGLRTIRRHLS